MPYIVSPRDTVAVCPGFGADTRGGGALPPVRITLLLPHATSASAIEATTSVRIPRRIRIRINPAPA